MKCFIPFHRTKLTGSFFRYCQVGNVVAVSVSKTLGYALGIAFGKLSGDEALMTLPPGFAFHVPPPPLEEFSSQL